MSREGVPPPRSTDAKLTPSIAVRAAAAGKAVLVDLAIDETFAKSVRNLPNVVFVPSARLTARAVMHADRVVATRGAIEKLQETLG